MELTERGLEHKSDANQLFKLGRVRTAFKRYKKSIDYLIIARELVEEKIKTFNEMAEENPDPSELQQLKEKLVQAQAQVYSNMALCQLKTKRFDLAWLNCTKCLEIDAKNVKALFRRGQARTCLKDYDDAIVDFRRVLELDADNQEARTSLANCERLKKDYEKELASNLKKMFT